MRALALLAILLVPFFPAAPAPLSQESAYNGFVNGDFEAGTPITIDTTTDPVNTVMVAVGSVLPGATENRGEIAAAHWTLRVFSGQRTPYSSVRWGAGIGMPYGVPQLGAGDKSAALEITFDERDKEQQTLVLTQAIGQRPHLGWVKNPTSLTLYARTPFGGQALNLTGGVYSVEDRLKLSVTNTVTVNTQTYTKYTLTFPPAVGTITQFYLIITGVPGASQDSTIYLDSLSLNGEVLVPAFDRRGSIIEPWTRETCRLTGVCV